MPPFSFTFQSQQRLLRPGPVSKKEKPSRGKAFVLVSANHPLLGADAFFVQLMRRNILPISPLDSRAAG